MTSLGEYNYASADEYLTDDEASTSYRLFVTVSPKPCQNFALSCDQQYNLHMPPLMKLLKHFDFFGSVEFTKSRGLFHIHCMVEIHNDKDRVKWMKTIKPLKQIGNTDIKLVKDTQKDVDRIYKYIHKDQEVTELLLDKYNKTLLDTQYATSYDKSNLSQVELTAPLDLGITKLSIKKKQTDSTESPPMA